MKKTLKRRKEELEHYLKTLYKKRASPTTGYRDFSRTEPFADDIEQIKYEIGQIDTKITRRREIVISLIIGSIIGSVITALITKLINKIF